MTKLKLTSSCILLHFLFLFFFSLHVSSQTCQKTCGQIPIKYPLGTGSGCGDPRFTRYITCDDFNHNQQTLTLTTHTGCYSIISVDYSKQVIYLTDQTMSTCTCTRPSHGFGLDWDAPFSFHDDTVFTLLDCSIDDESPFFTPLSNGSSSSSSSGGRVSLCDRQTSSICSFLYSNCRAISAVNVEVSRCCVYVPLDLGPSFEMDLEKLKCSSYSSFYNLSPGQESKPENWNYGVAVKYKFNVFDEYPLVCSDCEKSNGACGYNTQTNSFLCNCPGGINTTSDCFFLYNNFASTINNIPWISRDWVMYSMTWAIVWMVMNLH